MSYNKACCCVKFGGFPFFFLFNTRSFSPRYGSLTFGDNFQNLPTSFTQSNSSSIQGILKQYNAKVRAYVGIYYFPFGNLYWDFESFCWSLLDFVGIAS